MVAKLIKQSNRFIDLPNLTWNKFVVFMNQHIYRSMTHHLCNMVNTKLATAQHHGCKR